MKKIFSIICLCLMCAFASAQVVEAGSLKDNWYISGNVAVSELAAYIANSGKSYVIEGYASEEGPIDFNNKLANARAESMKKALVNYGAPEDKLTVKGCGVTTDFGDNEFNRIVIVFEQ